eukprot:5339613-Prorocentrum_lima.AAC.1
MGVKKQACKACARCAVGLLLVPCAGPPPLVTSLPPSPPHRHCYAIHNQLARGADATEIRCQHMASSA